MEFYENGLQTKDNYTEHEVHDFDENCSTCFSEQQAELKARGGHWSDRPELTEEGLPSE